MLVYTMYAAVCEAFHSVPRKKCFDATYFVNILFNTILFLAKKCCKQKAFKHVPLKKSARLRHFVKCNDGAISLIRSSYSATKPPFEYAIGRAHYDVKLIYSCMPLLTLSSRGAKEQGA